MCRWANLITTWLRGGEQKDETMRYARVVRAACAAEASYLGEEFILNGKTRAQFVVGHIVSLSYASVWHHEHQVSLDHLHTHRRAPDGTTASEKKLISRLFPRHDLTSEVAGSRFDIFFFSGSIHTPLQTFTEGHVHGDARDTSESLRAHSLLSHVFLVPFRSQALILRSGYACRPHVHTVNSVGPGVHSQVSIPTTLSPHLVDPSCEGSPSLQDTPFFFTIISLLLGSRYV